MLKPILFTAFGLLSLVAAQIQEPMPSPCPKKMGVTGFSAEKFAGDWVEYKRYAHTNASRQCVKATIKNGQNGEIFIDEQYKNIPDTEVHTDTDTFTLPDPNVGRMVQNNKTEILVLDVDYSNYAFLWTCDAVEGTNKSITSIYVLTRGKPLTTEAENKINQLMLNANIDPTTITSTEQSTDVCTGTVKPNSKKNGASLMSSSIATLIVFSVFRFSL